MTIDMPYGPRITDPPHQGGIDVVYADGYAKFVRVSNSVIPSGNSKGDWWDEVHEADGQ